MISKYSLNK